MKVLFAGPSIAGQNACTEGLDVRPPAALGCIGRAVDEGATAIGLIDGYFELVASVWHKEILFALAEGVYVLGAASMGALRAAECAAFGMQPIGSIAQAYLSGELDDDSAVALLHGPVELGSPRLTEPLVDAIATLDHLRHIKAISTSIWQQARARAADTFYKQRTIEAIFSFLTDPRHRQATCTLYVQNHVSPKTSDALLLIDALHALPATRHAQPGNLNLTAAQNVRCSQF